MAQLRIDRLHRLHGALSRREVKQLIRQGRVLVDGDPRPSGGQGWTRRTAEIPVDGSALA